MPADLPSISSTGDKEEQWELRAAKLAQGGQPSPGIVPKGYDGEEVAANSDVSSFPSFLLPFSPFLFFFIFALFPFDYYLGGREGFAVIFWLVGWSVFGQLVGCGRMIDECACVWGTIG